MCQIGLGGLKSLFLLCATVTWLAGLGLFVLSHLATKSQGLKRADDMVKADTMDGDGVPISLHLFFLSLLTVGVLSLFFSVCACTGVALKKRTFIVAYVFGCMFLGVAALTITMLMGDVYAVLLPTMRRQITEFCLPDAYATFSYELRTKEPRDLTCVATATRPKEAPDGAVIALRRSLEGETDLQRALMTSPQHDEVRALSTAISSAAVPARKNDVQELRLAEVEHQPQRTKATMFLPRITNFAKTVGLLKGGEKLELITDAETEWDEDEKMLPKRIEEDYCQMKKTEKRTKPTAPSRFAGSYATKGWFFFGPWADARHCTTCARSIPTTPRQSCTALPPTPRWRSFTCLSTSEHCSSAPSLASGSSTRW
ncbi:unnamed protein product [Amoebophrya sp. A120]|nr:unnamed protein product [Amoebophrya sp. A120]|eukprot:GSA120T00013206001.1